MSILVLILLISPLFALRVSAQPLQGNWVVSGAQTVQNESITLDGNLTVENGGSLTLRNVTLVVDSSYDDQYGIQVLQGGSMFIYNSTIKPGASSKRFTFVVEGNDFVIEGTSLQGVGLCGSSDQSCYGTANNSHFERVGLVIFSSGAQVTGDTIFSCGIGLVLYGSNDIIHGNTIGPNDVGAITDMGLDEQITGNTILHDGTASTFIVYVAGTNGSTIAGNSYLQVSTSWSTYNEIYFVFLTQSNYDIVENNTVSSAVSAPGLFPVDVQGGSNLRIINNTETRAGTISLYTGANNFVESNTTPVIYLDHEYNSVVVNNTLTGLQGPYNVGGSASDLQDTVLGMTYSSGNYILNNHIDS
ncbi:MAG: hypothetical protein KGI26_02970, partial [Thaumarchaeota archaeon]|nr:hypothetical protein [Nitrososphaerota archaeon]